MQRSRRSGGSKGVIIAIMSVPSVESRRLRALPARARDVARARTHALMDGLGLGSLRQKVGDCVVSSRAFFKSLTLFEVLLNYSVRSPSFTAYDPEHLGDFGALSVADFERRAIRLHRRWSRASCRAAVITLRYVTSVAGAGGRALTLMCLCLSHHRRAAAPLFLSARHQ